MFGSLFKSEEPISLGLDAIVTKKIISRAEAYLRVHRFLKKHPVSHAGQIAIGTGLTRSRVSAILRKGYDFKEVKREPTGGSRPIGYWAVARLQPNDPPVISAETLCELKESDRKVRSDKGLKKA